MTDDFSLPRTADYAPESFRNDYKKGVGRVIKKINASDNHVFFPVFELRLHKSPINSVRELIIHWENNEWSVKILAEIRCFENRSLALGRFVFHLL